MAFQGSVAVKQGFDVPGEVFQDVPWTVLSYILESSGQPNIIGSTAYTITDDGVAQAGSGGTFGFAGILCMPKSYTLTGVGGSALAPSKQLADGTQAELLSDGMIAVMLPAAANIGDLVIYNNTTGALATMAPTDQLPVGFSFANAIVSQFTQTISGEGIAIIHVNQGSYSTAGNIFNYQNTIWVAKNGNDDNEEFNIDTPKATMAAAFAEINAGGVWVINVVDGGDFDCANLTPATDPGAVRLIVNAPGVNFTNTTSDPIFDPDIFDLVVNCKGMFFRGLGVGSVGDNCNHRYNVDIFNVSLSLSATVATAWVYTQQMSNNTLTTPDGSTLYIECLSTSFTTVSNPANVYGRIGEEFYPASGNAVFTYVETPVAMVTALVGHAYVMTALGGTQTVNMPVTDIVGDQVKVQGLSAATWVAQFPAGDACFYGSVVTSAGGTITSTNPTDAAVFTHIASGVWTVEYTNPNAVLIPA